MKKTCDCLNVCGDDYIAFREGRRQPCETFLRWQHLDHQSKDAARLRKLAELPSLAFLAELPHSPHASIPDRYRELCNAIDAQAVPGASQ